jgi:peptidoglycan-associated lipoprotein
MKSLSILFPLVLAATACGSDPPPPAEAPPASAPAPAPATTAAPPPEKEGDNPSQSNIQIAEEIRKACGISEADAYFGYNSADVRPQDKAILNQLAKCFTTGPLKGRLMRLVGHADPRGEPEYNMAIQHGPRRQSR